MPDESNTDAATAPGSPPEGIDGSVVFLRERTIAVWWWWIVIVVCCGALGIAYGYALTPIAGWATFAVTAGVVGLATVAMSSELVVDECVIRVGQARLPLRHVGRVFELDRARTRAARGGEGDPRAFLYLRSWIPTSVVVEVDDPTDPHPYWLISTRRPERVSEAIRRAVAFEPPGAAPGTRT